MIAPARGCAAHGQRGTTPPHISNIGGFSQSDITAPGAHLPPNQNRVMSSPLPTRLTRSVGLVFTASLVVAVALGAPPSVAAKSARAAGTAAPIQAAATATTASVSTWQWPVEAPHPVIRSYASPATRYSAGHRGIDIAAAPGDLVRAPAAAVVHFVGVVVDRPVVSLRHPSGVLSSFEPVESDLQIGETVAAGERIGVIAPITGDAEGAAAHCRDPCLHFGVRRDGEYVSPMLYLVGIPRSVLLPTRAISP